MKFILAADGFYYKMTKNNEDRSVCIKINGGEFYTVRPDKYELDEEGNLYPVNAINEKIAVQSEKFNEHELEEYKCSKVVPIPKILFDGGGSCNCSPATGICDINAPKGTKISMGAPKGYKKMFDGNKAWLKEMDHDF